MDARRGTLESKLGHGTTATALSGMFFAVAAVFARLHICLRRSCPALKSSTHFWSNGGNGRPCPPSCGSPASSRSPSKYALNSGLMTVNAGPSPRNAMRPVSHVSCSSAEGRVARPARTRAAATACHSKTLKERDYFESELEAKTATSK